MPAGEFARGASTDYALGIEAVIPTRHAGLSIRADVGETRHADRDSPPITALDMFGNSLTFTTYVHNSLIWFDVGPEIERPAGRGTAFTFATLGLLRVSPVVENALVSIFAPQSRPEPNGGWSAGVGGGWRFQTRPDSRLWVALEGECRTCPGRDYFGEVIATTPPGGLTSFHATHGSVTTWGARVALLMSPP